MKAYQEIGKKLQKAREEAGLSQDELSKMLGYTQSSLSNYELGKRRLYLVELQRISEILGKPVTYFLEDSKDNETEQNDVKAILKTPHIKEIIFAVQNLKPAQRKSVLDYIQWQKSQR
jgi:transcriptional regulator with XRE-family HTH domain